jgi:putative membrane protein
MVIGANAMYAQSTELGVTMFVAIAAVIVAALMAASCATAERAAPIFLSDANIVSIMNSADRSNIEGGRLAEKHGTGPEVQAFGRQMITDHSAMLEKNKRLSERFTIEPLSSALNKEVIENHAAALDALKRKSGKEFDRTYINHEIERHERLSKLVDKAATTTNHVALKELLRQAEPTLQQHLESARRIKQLLVAQPD